MDLGRLHHDLRITFHLNPIELIVGARVRQRIRFGLGGYTSILACDILIVEVDIVTSRHRPPGTNPSSVFLAVTPTPLWQSAPDYGPITSHLPSDTQISKNQSALIALNQKSRTQSVHAHLNGANKQGSRRVRLLL